MHIYATQPTAQLAIGKVKIQNPDDHYFFLLDLDGRRSLGIRGIAPDKNIPKRQHLGRDLAPFRGSKLAPEGSHRCDFLSRNFSDHKLTQSMHLLLLALSSARLFFTCIPAPS